MQTPTEALSRIEECKKNKSTTLDLSDLGLTQIPPEIFDFIWLKVVSLSYNQISKIERLDKLVNISELFLHNNQISKIEGLETLINISRLYLSYNQISKIEGLETLVNISELSLSNNQITKIEALKSLIKISELYLSNNQITKIEGLETLVNILVLDLDNNRITKIEDLETLINISVLDLDCNQITKMEGLGTLINILELYLSSNQIIKIEGLVPLINISRLDLSNNQITKIEGLVPLINISRLDLSNNQITKIEGLETLVNISRLYLDDNQITKIEGLGTLRKISTLNLSNNQITKIEGLEELVNISEMRLHNNPLDGSYNLTLTNYENHWGQIKNILDRKKEAGSEIRMPVKVILLGNHGSGKSSLLYYLQNGKFSTKINSTHLLKIEHYPQKSSIPKAIFYDFGGQDFYHGIYRMFMNNGSVYFLLWRETNNTNVITPDKKGRPNQNFCLSYWFGQKTYRETQNEPFTDPVLLVESHAIAHKKPSYFEQRYDVEQSFYVSLNSVYNPNKNQKALEYLKAVFDEILEKEIEKRKTKQPLWYQEFYKYIINSSTIESVGLEVLLNYYKPSNKKDKEEIKESLQDELEQLHNQGLALYYRRIDADRVWLNPSGLVQYIHKTILNQNKISKFGGIVPIAKFPTVDSKLLQLLEEQKVIFRHKYGKDGEEYIIPNFLPLISGNQIEYDLLTFGLNNPLFVLKFQQFLPVTLINQLICFFGKQPDIKKFWRDQLLFTFSESGQKLCQVLIKLDFQSLEIMVYVSFSENVAESKKHDIAQYFFYVIMCMYWDLPKIEGISNYKQDKKEKKVSISTLLDSGAVISIEDKTVIEDVFDRYNAFNIIFQEKEGLPSDLYVSRDDKYFVKYDLLKKQNPDKLKIAALRRNSKLDLESSFEIQVKPFEVFTNKKFNKMKKIFISYSRQDNEFKEQLKKYLGMLTLYNIADNWSCESIVPGLWHEQIQKELDESDVIVFMLSMSFFDSYYILNEEIKKGIELAKKSGKQIVCVLVRTFPMITANKFIDEERALTSEDGYIYYLEEINKYQFLPYDNNIKSNMEKGTKSALKPLEDWENISKPMSQIVEKIAEILK